MSAHKSWLRRLDRLEAGLPLPPAGAPYWLKAFEVIAAELGLTTREPDFAAALAAYRATRPPYVTEEAVLRHDHLLELGQRALDGVPPCSVAEFAGLAAWLAEYGAALPTVNGWKKDLDLGDGTNATLSVLTWRVAKGATADGSGRLAETIRRLKAWYEGRPAPAEAPGSRRAAPTSGWVPSVVRDDSNGDAPG